jgi:hypothetical protein
MNCSACEVINESTEGELTMNDTCKKALAIMRYIANRAASGYEYRNYWGDKTRLKEIDGFFENSAKESDADFWNAVFQLPDEQKQMLGFCKWSDEEKEMCIPMWIWACLPDDMPIGGNGGGKMKKDLDNDTRFGCVWWRV